MRTPRLFLGVFALALILLLLACGGSDEPTDGPASERATAAPTDLPDSERATDEPEGRASSGQTTAAPTPKATAAQTSPEPDREALVALYNATGGPNWDRISWPSYWPISEWTGVTTDDNGCVTELYLTKKQLSGEIPPELGNLTNLIKLDLSRNQLTGEIPPELGNLANLKVLILWAKANQLTGCVPSSLSPQLDMINSNLGGLPFCP